MPSLFRFCVPLLLTVAGCASAPEAPPPASATTPATPASTERGDLIGLDAAAVGERFGTPALTIREGEGTKVQYRSGESCVLDLWLYPPVGGGAARTTHVEARDRQARPVALAACVAGLTR